MQDWVIELWPSGGFGNPLSRKHIATSEMERMTNLARFAAVRWLLLLEYKPAKSERMDGVTMLLVINARDQTGLSPYI